MTINSSYFDRGVSLQPRHLPKAPVTFFFFSVIDMKRVRLNQDVGYWGIKGQIYDVADSRAKWLLQKRLRRENDELTVFRLAELVEDLGRHIGPSKFTYVPGKRSTASFDRRRERLTVMKRLGLDKPKKKFLCKLCGYADCPDDYAMSMRHGRWCHDICLERKRRGLPPIGKD